MGPWIIAGNMGRGGGHRITVACSTGATFVLSYSRFAILLVYDASKGLPFVSCTPYAVPYFSPMGSYLPCTAVSIVPRQWKDMNEFRGRRTSPQYLARENDENQSQGKEKRKKKTLFDVPVDQTHGHLRLRVRSYADIQAAREYGRNSTLSLDNVVS